MTAEDEESHDNCVARQFAAPLDQQSTNQHGYVARILRARQPISTVPAVNCGAHLTPQSRCLADIRPLPKRETTGTGTRRCNCCLHRITRRQTPQPPPPPPHLIRHHHLQPPPPSSLRGLVLPRWPRTPVRTHLQSILLYLGTAYDDKGVLR